MLAVNPPGNRTHRLRLVRGKSLYFESLVAILGGASPLRAVGRPAAGDLEDSGRGPQDGRARNDSTLVAWGAVLAAVA
jgi:hypothetical protein